MSQSNLLTRLIVCSSFLLVTFAHGSKNPDLIYSQASDMKNGGHTSPDGKFVVVSRSGMGEVTHISVYDKSNSGKIVYQSSFVDGFNWLPGRKHALVFAVSSDNNGETPGLFLWQKGKRPGLIKKLKRPSRENVELLGISRDGHNIAYLYWPNTSGMGFRSGEGPFVKSLMLP